jgi:PLP dependent protein
MSGEWVTGQPVDGVLRTRLAAVRDSISAAAKMAGRDPAGISLIAVSKTVDVPVMAAAMRLGVSQFGENRVQDYLRKCAALQDSASWHFIGRLQTNKVRQLAGRNLLIHSFDRIALLEEMVRETKKTGFHWHVLAEVNISGEETKTGVAPGQLEVLLQNASASGCVSVHGLMTIAPNLEDPEKTRPIFRRLKELAIDMGSRKLFNVSMDILSMGMSNDFTIAVEEGATHIRVGTAIFGSRYASREEGPY